MLRECRNCGTEFEGTERAKFCSTKCRVQSNRVTENKENVTQTRSVTHTKTDKEFQEHYSKIKDFGPDWLKFGQSIRNPKCHQCGKDFKTRLQLLIFCSLQCRRDALSPPTK